MTNKLWNVLFSEVQNFSVQSFPCQFYYQSFSISLCRGMFLKILTAKIFVNYNSPFCCFSVLTTVARATISSSFMFEKSLRFYVLDVRNRVLQNGLVYFLDIDIEHGARGGSRWRSARMAHFPETRCWKFRIFFCQFRLIGSEGHKTQLNRALMTRFCDALRKITLRLWSTFIPISFRTLVAYFLIFNSKLTFIKHISELRLFCNETY